MEKALLILDLDETLLYAGAPIDAKEHVPDFYTKGMWYTGYPVYKRPFLEEFLQRVNKLYKLAVWSSAGTDHIASCVANIIPGNIDLEFIWSSKRCIYTYDPEWRRRVFGIKPLKKVKRRGYNLERTLIVDNSAYKCVKNYGNAIYIKDFYGSPEDEELRFLTLYLEHLADHSNYRDLEKRGWRSWAEKQS